MPFRAVAIVVGVAIAAAAAPQAQAVQTDRLDPSIFKYDTAMPLDLQSGDRDVFDGYVRRDVSYRSPIEGRVPAYVIEPSVLPPGRRVPALILMHGLPGSRNAMVPLAAAYARTGVIALCLSAPFVRELPYREATLIPAPRFDDYDRREMIQVAMDVARAIDLLVADPRVDPARIAFIGFSYGGAIGVLMSAIEPRFRTLALMSPTGGLMSWVQMAPDFHPIKQRFMERSEAARKTWLISMSPVEPVRWLAATASPRPFLLQAARHDENVSPADTAQIIAAARTAATIQWYESGHELPESAAMAQAAFLSAALGFNVTGFVAPVGRR